MSTSTRYSWVAVLLLALLLGAGAVLRPSFSRMGRERQARPDSLPTASDGRETEPVQASPRSGVVGASSKPTEELSPANVRSRVQEAATWKERVAIIKSIARADLERLQDFLFEVAEGGDVDAVRSAALTGLEKLGRESPSSAWLVHRFCARLPQEPRDCLRNQLLVAIEHLYIKHPEENAFGFDAVLDRLKNDAEPRVRVNAAGVMSYFAFFARERAAMALKWALELEKDAEVRKAIQAELDHIAEMKD